MDSQQLNIQDEGLHEEEAKQPIAVPNEEEGDCTQEGEEEWVYQGEAMHAIDDGTLEQGVVDLCLFFPFLYLAVEEEEVQPAAEPNEQEDDDTGEQEEPGKDRCCPY